MVCGVPLESGKEERKVNPEEFANEFEGDIVLRDTEITRSGRNGLTDTSKRWPKDNKGQVTVPYTIQGDYSKKHVKSRKRF